MTAGPLYPKIQSVWKRDGKGIILPGEYATSELLYLSQIPWQWTEKVDGTNIRLHWNGSSVIVGGRSDNAQIPVALLDVLRESGWLDATAWGDAFGYGETSAATVYGEGFGGKIQSGGNYRATPSFIAFDCFVPDAHQLGGWWLDRANLADVCEKLNIPIVPGAIEATIPQMCLSIEQKQVKSDWPGVTIEGAVGRPLCDLFDRRGNRLLVKIKTKDFEAYRRERAKVLGREA